jgi:N-methylhydantoinase B
MRQAIAALPDGTWTAHTFIDGFEDSDDPSRRDLRIQASVTIAGDSLTVDLTGTAPQVSDRPINMPFEGTVDIAVWLTIRSILLDTAIFGHIAVNEGLTRPITIIAPKGCLANPIFPAPTIARFSPGNQLADTVMKALAQVVPERVSAGIGNLRVMAFSGETADGPWVHMEIFEGSYGGRQGSDGMDAVDTLFANTRNNPVEDVESHLPLRVRRYELRDGAVGAGRWRGGLGSIREFEMLTDGGVSIEGDGHTYRPWGFAGGGDGHTATMRLMSGNTKSALPSKSPYRRVRSGDRFQCEGPAGGGYGPAMQRDPEAVRADVLDGLLSAAEARAVFGVALTEALALDHAGTAALRA